MLKPLTAAHRLIQLTDIGAVRAQGPDVVKFLQGQVSNDVTRVAADRSVLAGLHNAQGRAIALLRLVLVGPDEIVALVPKELAAGVAARLAKFVLRAKVKVADATSDWKIAGVEAAGIAEGMGDARVGAARRDEQNRLWICVSAVPTRWLVITRATAGEPLAAAGSSGTAAAFAFTDEPAVESITRDEWRARDIADGIPQVYAATSEAFVAQMLNLDVLDGIAFDKGCYTGQEVIARAHYRGRVKRRMQRFRTKAPASLNIGDTGTLGDGRGFRVVDAVKLVDGHCEFLAVAPLAGVSAEAEEPVAQPLAGSPSPGGLDVESLPLPYSLPD